MLGVFAAIGASLSWTFACFIWRRQKDFLNAIEINLFKTLIAVLIFSPFLVKINWRNNIYEIGILIISGFLGIAVGDSLYLNSLNRIGTRKTLSIEALSPIFANSLGTIMLGEMLPINSWIGAIVVTLSLAGITKEKSLSNETYAANKSEYNKGILFAFLSVICGVLAAIMSRYVLINSDFSPIQTTEIRLFGALLCLIACNRPSFTKKIRNLSLQNKSNLFLATILGTNLGILLQQFVFKSLPIGIGWTILSTSPIFALFLAKNEGEKVTLVSILLSLTTLTGVGIVLL